MNYVKMDVVVLGDAMDFLEGPPSKGTGTIDGMPDGGPPIYAIPPAYELDE